MDSLNTSNVLKERDVRQFLYEFILESCGVDLASPLPTSKPLTDFEQGKRKIAIDLLNILLYNDSSLLIRMINENKKQENLK